MTKFSSDEGNFDQKQMDELVDVVDLFHLTADFLRNYLPIAELDMYKMMLKSALGDIKVKRSKGNHPQEIQTKPATSEYTLQNRPCR